MDYDGMLSVSEIHQHVVSGIASFIRERNFRRDNRWRGVRQTPMVGFGGEGGKAAAELRRLRLFYCDAGAPESAPALEPLAPAVLPERAASVRDGALSAAMAGELAGIAEAARAGRADALERYFSFAARARRVAPELPGRLPELAGPGDAATVEQLGRLDALLAQARRAAAAAIEGEDGAYSELSRLEAKALADSGPNRELAAERIAGYGDNAGEYVLLRDALVARLQDEMRKNREIPGTRLALSMLRTANDDPDVVVYADTFRYDADSASTEFSVRGMRGRFAMGRDDYETRIRLELGGYAFVTGWYLLFHKPLLWAAALAEDMRAAGVEAASGEEWRIVEGPGGVMAISSQPSDSDAARRVFYHGAIRVGAGLE